MHVVNKIKNIKLCVAVNTKFSGGNLKFGARFNLARKNYTFGSRDSTANYMSEKNNISLYTTIR